MQFPFEKSASPFHSRFRYFSICSPPPAPEVQWKTKQGHLLSNGKTRHFSLGNVSCCFFFTSIFTCKFALLLRPCFILGKHLGGKFPASPCNYPGCMACSSLLPTAPKTVTTGTSLCICQLRMIKKEASRGPIYFFFLFKTFGNNLSSCIRAHSVALSLLLPTTAPLSPPELPKWTDVCSSGSRFNPQSAEQTHR